MKNIMIRKLKCNIIYNKNKQLDKALNNNSNKGNILKIFVNTSFFSSNNSNRHN